MPKKDPLQELQTLRTFLSDCYSFIRAEITSEELSTFGISDAISSRIQAIGDLSDTDSTDLTLLSRVDHLKTQIVNMVPAAKTMTPYKDTSPQESKIQGGTLGFPKKGPLADSDLAGQLYDMYGALSAEDNAHNINNDVPVGTAPPRETVAS
jgi:hypothetical protein